MSIAFKNASRTSSQGKNMPGTPQVFRAGRRIGQSPQSSRPVVGRYAGGTSPTEQIDRHGKRRAEHRGILLHHHRQCQAVANLGCQGSAKHPTAARKHEIDRIFGYALGGAHKIAFVLPVGIIYHDDDAPGFEILQRIFYLTEYPFGFLHFFPFVCSIVFFVCISAAPSPTGGRKG